MTAHDREEERKLDVHHQSPTLHLRSPCTSTHTQNVSSRYVSQAYHQPNKTLTTHLSDATQNTPLAPSVEKAYYRKCIELKRRLNDVEEANDAARQRKARLNRAIMKMRLERAFLLEQLAKRLQNTTDGPGKPANNNNSANSD
jgi:hypothetical protein